MKAQLHGCREFKVALKAKQLVTSLHVPSQPSPPGTSTNTTSSVLSALLRVHNKCKHTQVLCCHDSMRKAVFRPLLVASTPPRCFAWHRAQSLVMAHQFTHAQGGHVVRCKHVLQHMQTGWHKHQAALCASGRAYVGQQLCWSPSK